MPVRLPIAVAAALAAWPALAFDLPAHRPGLWEMTVAKESRNASPFALQRCTDASTDNFISALIGATAAEACARHDVRQDGNRIVMDSTCKVGPVTSSAHAEIVGSFEQAYTIAVTTRQSGEGASRDERRITIDAKWLGPCAADQKPGDILLPGGFKLNVRNIRGLMGLLGGMQ